MCGICGIVRGPSTPPIDRETLLRMRDVLTHRGPDEAGMYLQGEVGLAHRRLSIIDLSSAGRQPMSNEDGTVWLTYNGEVYNYRELQAELQSRGHIFRSRTDSEVLVHLYEEMGERMVSRLRGMFAFAIWDQTRHRLLLGRDRFGIKPLYYLTTEDGTLIFGSEIKAILASRVITPKLRRSAISEYLANRFTTGAGTLYEGVKRLLPAHTAIWRDGRLATTRYWKPPVVEGGSDGVSEAQHVRSFARCFDESVQLRMISDAPIGVFLSGGVDSSAIAAVMAEHSTTPINTFSVAFRERESNELAHARRVAHLLGTHHAEVVVSPRDFFQALPKLIWHEDEPIAFPSSVPLYFVSHLAAERVKVVLTGEGSDELLAGYGKYARAVYNLRAANAYAHLPRWFRMTVRKGVERLPRQRFTNRLRRTFLYRDNTVDSLYLQNFSVFDSAMQARLLSPAFRKEVNEGEGNGDPFAGLHEVLAGIDDVPLLPRLLILDWQTYLQELLMKQDQMSMAASIESRVPFLDHELAHLVAALPDDLKLRGLTTKRVLRLAMRGRIPRSILRRRKMGFPTPVGAWLRGEFKWIVDDVVLSEQARSRGMFDYEYVAQLVQQHCDGTADHTERLWALLNVELWCRTCLDGQQVDTPTFGHLMPHLR